MGKKFVSALIFLAVFLTPLAHGETESVNQENAEKIKVIIQKFGREIEDGGYSHKIKQDEFTVNWTLSEKKEEELTPSDAAMEMTIKRIYGPLWRKISFELTLTDYQDKNGYGTVDELAFCLKDASSEPAVEERRKVYWHIEIAGSLPDSLVEATARIYGIFLNYAAVTQDRPPLKSPADEKLNRKGLEILQKDFEAFENFVSQNLLHNYNPFTTGKKTSIKTGAIGENVPASKVVPK